MSSQTQDLKQSNDDSDVLPSDTIHSPNDTAPAQPARASIVNAFASAVVVAVAALLVAMPAFRPGTAIAGPLLLAAWLGMATLGARRLPARRRLPWSALAGVGTSALLLIFLGSLLTQPVIDEGTLPETPAGTQVARLRPDALLIVGGFLVLGAIVGALAALVARAIPRRASAWPWSARMAATAVAATLPLLLLGGLVTSTESGMAVPDWPGSYGANMVLFPLGLMADPRIFLEHAHRLFGMLVGITTLATAFAVQFSTPDRRGSGAARTVAWAAVVLVIVQAVLGGTSVIVNSAPLRVLHGIIGQVFFVTLASLVVLLLPSWAARPLVSPRLSRFAKIVLGLLLVQLTFGAMFRHMGADSWHPLAAHVALSLVIVIMAPILGARLGKSGDPATGIPDPAPAARNIGKALMHATGFQFLLGWGALAGAWMGRSRGPVPLHTQLREADPVPLWEIVLTTLHQANGAILLAAAGLAVVWTLRRVDPKPAAVPPPG